jgi:hypothetical protein
MGAQKLAHASMTSGKLTSSRWGPRRARTSTSLFIKSNRIMSLSGVVAGGCGPADDEGEDVIGERVWPFNVARVLVHCDTLRSCSRSSPTHGLICILFSKCTDSLTILDSQYPYWGQIDMGRRLWRKLSLGLHRRAVDFKRSLAPCWACRNCEGGGVSDVDGHNTTPTLLNLARDSLNSTGGTVQFCVDFGSEAVL